MVVHVGSVFPCFFCHREESVTTKPAYTFNEHLKAFHSPLTHSCCLRIKPPKLDVSEVLWSYRTIRLCRVNISLCCGSISVKRAAVNPTRRQATPKQHENDPTDWCLDQWFLWMMWSSNQLAQAQSEVTKFSWTAISVIYRYIQCYRCVSYVERVVIMFSNGATMIILGPVCCTGTCPLLQQRSRSTSLWTVAGAGWLCLGHTFQLDFRTLLLRPSPSSSKRSKRTCWSATVRSHGFPP